MSDSNGSRSPSSGNGGTPAACTTTTCFKCWADDYDKEISVSPFGRYNESYKRDGTAHNYIRPVKYKIYVPTKTSTKITVEVRIKVEAQTGVSSADIATAKTNLENGVNTHWNGKFSLKAEDPEAACGSKNFNVEYKVVWIAFGQHYTMKVHSIYAREGVNGDIINVAKTTTAWTYAHEFAHCVGLPDEYSYTADNETVKYYKPDGSLGLAITAPPEGKPKTAADATIMSAVNNTKTLKRHCWNIAIEAQELLRAKIRRNIVCTIN